MADSLSSCGKCGVIGELLDESNLCVACFDFELGIMSDPQQTYRRAYARQYAQRPESKAKQRAYRQRPEVKERRRQGQRVYRERQSNGG